MTGATGNIYTGLHEFNDMMLTLHFLRKGDLFLDIGANVGTYAVLASGACGADTWAFEPDPCAIRHLKRNIAVNGLEELIRVYDLALGASEDEVQFTTGLDTTNHVTSDRDWNTRIVRQKQLDAVIGEGKPIMIKLDVEGYEEKVLLGAQKLLANPCLQLIVLETVTPLTESILAGHNFESAYYDPFARELSHSRGNYTSCNSIYVRNLKAIAMRLVSARAVTVLGRAI